MRKNIKNKIVALSLLMGMSLMLNVLVPTTRLVAEGTESNESTSTEQSSQESSTEATTKKTEASKPTETSETTKPSHTDAGSFILIADKEIPKLDAGSKFKLRVPLVNWGAVNAKNIKVRLDLAEKAEDFPFEIEKSEYLATNKSQLETIEKYNKEEVEAKTKYFDFGELTVRKNLKSAYYRVPLKIYFNDDSNEVKEVVRYYFIKVQGEGAIDDNKAPKPEDQLPPNDNGYVPSLPQPEPEFPAPNPGGGDEPGKTSTPRVMVSGFTTSPEKIKGGENFTLKLQLRNTSKTTAVKNIRLVLGLGEEKASFIPLSGSSSVFVEQVNANSTVEVPIGLKASPLMEQKSYPVSVAIEYEDANGASFSTNESVTLQVYQDPVVEFTGLQILPSPMTVDNPSNITLTVINKGKSTLYNTSFGVEENGVLSAQESYLGNIAPAETKNVDTMVTPVKMSENGKAVVTLTFEDELGKKTTIKKEIDVEILEAMPEPSWEDPATPEEPEPETGFRFWPIVIVIVVIALIALLITLLLRRQAKKRKQEELEEIEDIDEIL